MAQPTFSSQAVGGRTQADVERISREFTQLYHDLRDQTLGRTRWLGISIVKTPMDMLALQEIIAETRPQVIVQAGVFAGGSTLYAASLLDLLKIDGKVIGIDVDLTPVREHIVRHPRVELLEGSSTDPAIVERLRAEAKGKGVMVNLDSDHRAEHVLEELTALAPLVTHGCYLVVEDTWYGGRPVRPEEAPGPAGALETWLAEGQPFQPDRWRERFLLTGNPGGYLRRVEPGEGAWPGPPRLDHFHVPLAEVYEGAGSAVGADGGPQAGDEQRIRNAHEAEYEELRAYARQLHAELEAREAELREKDRLLADAGTSERGGAIGPRARRRLAGLARAPRRRRGEPPTGR